MFWSRRQTEKKQQKEYKALLELPMIAQHSCEYEKEEQEEG